MQCDGCRLFSIEDSPLYNQLFAESQTEISDHCLNSRIAWNAGFYYQVSEIENCICLVSNGGVFTTPHVTFPLGHMTSEKLETIIDTLWPAFVANNWPFRLMYIDERNVSMVENLEKYSAKVSYNPDFSDYLYQAESLRTLQGRKLRTKRNHFNRFLRLYPDYTYRQLRQEDAGAALDLVQAWCDEKEVDCQNLTESDFRAIRNLFRHMDHLDVAGGVIEVDGRLVAFSMGSFAHGHTAVIHFEKADPAFDGAYAAINKLMLEKTFPDAVWVNREEDMGVPGLRKAKEDYQPIRPIHKYEAAIRRRERQ